MEITIPILYEDDLLLAINKPAGLLVHPDGTNTEPTLVDWILQNRPEIEGVGESERLKDGSTINRPGIVHRLDKDTTGVLLIAKTSTAYHVLKEGFADRLIKKTYHALAYGLFKEYEGVIEKPIARSARDFKKWSAEAGARGEQRDAITEYSVLGERRLDKDLMNLLSRPKGTATINGISYLELHPHTGRTHQLRVHLKSIGHPILNDELYAGSYPQLKAVDRIMLHAYRIVISTSIIGAEISLECPLPEDMKSALSLISF